MITTLTDVRTQPVWDVGEFTLDQLVDLDDGSPDLFVPNMTWRDASGVIQAIRDAGIGGFEVLDVMVAHRDNWWHYDHWRSPDDVAWHWHQDNPTPNAYIAMWTNILPTEVRRLDNGEPYPTEAGHLYLVHNAVFEHRGTIPRHPRPPRDFLRGGWIY